MGEIKVNKGSFKVNKNVCGARTQLKSQGEIALSPDGEPIEGIVCRKADIIIDESEVSLGRVSFKGALKVWGLYYGENKELYPYSYSLPVTDFVNCDNAKEGMWADVDACVTGLEATAVGKDKIFFKAVIDIAVIVSCNEECTYIEGIEGEKTEGMERFDTIEPSYCAVNTSLFTEIGGSLSLPMGKPNIERVLEDSLSLSAMDFKVGDNSLRVTGDLNLSLLYKGQGESNPMELYEGSIPFRAELSVEGLSQNMLTATDFYLKNTSVDIEGDEDGEKRVINIRADLAVKLKAMEKSEIKALEDLYIIGKCTDLSSTTVTGNSWVSKNISGCPLKEIIALKDGEPDMMQIYEAWGKPCIDFVKVNKGSVDIEGAVEVGIIYVSPNDKEPVCSTQAVIPFSYTAQAPLAESDMECTVSAYTEHISANMLSDREIEVRCLINITTLPEATETYNIVDNVTIGDMPADYLNSLPSITLYVVKKGDTLWQLAKRFNTTIESIVNVNDIENPDLIYPGQRLIIVKRVG